MDARNRELGDGMRLPKDPVKRREEVRGVPQDLGLEIDAYFTSSSA
jgi:hypothetical protein